MNHFKPLGFISQNTDAEKSHCSLLAHRDKICFSKVVYSDVSVLIVIIYVYRHDECQRHESIEEQLPGIGFVSAPTSSYVDKCAVPRTHVLVPASTFIALTLEIYALEVFVCKYHQTCILSLVKFKSRGRL